MKNIEMGTHLSSAPADRTGSPGTAVTAPGVLLSPSPDENARRIRPNAARRLVRPDYHRQVKITYAEAALIAGVSVNTVERWVSAGLIPRAAKVGPYRILREHLDKYLRTGARVI